MEIEMKKTVLTFIKRRLSFIMIAALMPGLSSMSFAAETEAETKQDIVILVTSDVHCGIDQGFGYEGLEQIREALQKNGDYTILVDDGDSIQGEPIGMITRGESMIDLMNAMDYDVAIPGNHEFDYGMDTFLNLTKRADFPYISCNLNKEGDTLLPPYVIKDVNGTKIAFVGVTTPKTLSTTMPKNFQDKEGNYIYGFLQEDETGEKLYEAVQSAVDDAREEGADYVIVMAHLGNEAECEPWTYKDVIANVSGIDILIDGHSHDTDQVTMIDEAGDEVVRMAVGTKLNGIGLIRISSEDGSITPDFYSWTNDVSLPELFGLENDMTGPIEEEKDGLESELQRVIGKTVIDLVINDPEAVDENGVPIRIVRRAETNLGDLVTDAFLYASGADIAFANGGGIRADITEGNITYEDILKVYPFSNTICVIEATGQQILDALEWGARAVPEECGGFLQAAGMTYEIHTDIESSCVADENGMFAGVKGEYRVQNVMIGDEPLDSAKTYTLASQNYTVVENGEGFTMFDGCDVVQEIPLDNQVLIQYLTGPLEGVVSDEYADPYGQGRIVAVEDSVEKTEE